MILTDTFLEMGSGHKICQDYIDRIDWLPGIILADGCSSSAKSEIGAMLLTLVAKKELQMEWTSSLYTFNNNAFGSTVIRTTEKIRYDLQLPPSSLDSSLIVSFYDKNTECLLVYFYGDGYIITQDQNDKINVVYVKYEDIQKLEFPFYLSYQLDPNRIRQYVDMSIIQNVFMNDQKIIKLGTDRFDYRISMKDKKSVLICSDGIGTFTKGVEKVDFNEIIKMVLIYPAPTGEFLKRTMNHQLKKLKAEGITHYDDLSIGAYLVK